MYDVNPISVPQFAYRHSEKKCNFAAIGRLNRTNLSYIAYAYDLKMKIVRQFVGRNKMIKKKKEKK